MSQQEDLYYIQRVLNGDMAAFEFLVDGHQEMVFTIALRIVRNREDAEEVAQDTFVKAYQSLSSFKQESKFSTWLYRIVYNTAISKTRKKQLETAAEDVGEYGDHVMEQTVSQLDQIKMEEQKQYISAALEALPQEEATLITLYYLSENSVEEIHEITGLSKANVKVKLYRSRKRLYIELQRLLKNEMLEIL